MKPISRHFPKVITRRSRSNRFDTNVNIKLSKPKLHPEQVSIVEYYTGSGSDYINGFLRGYYNTKDISDKNEEYVKIISSSIQNNRIKKSLYLYHSFTNISTNISKLIKSNKNKISILEFKGFVSTSLNHETSLAFTVEDYKNRKHCLKIKTPDEFHGIYVDNYSIHSGEREVLLHYGAKLAIHPIPSICKKYNIVTWHSNLIHDGVEYTSLHMK